MADELNPLYIFQLTHTNLLKAILRGDVDLQVLVRHELACRGLDANGRFVGFTEARRLHTIKPARQAQETP